jgi:hypothetical protein
MTVRASILGVLSLAFLAGGFTAMWFGTVGIFDIPELTSALVEDQEAWALQQAWVNMLYSVGGPLVGAGLIAGVGALALVVRARQAIGSQAIGPQAGSASATASREAARS